MFTDYRPRKGYDEYFSASEEPRSALQPLLSSLGALGLEQLNRNHTAAGMLLKRLGATSASTIPATAAVSASFPLIPCHA